VHQRGVPGRHCLTSLFMGPRCEITAAERRMVAVDAGVQIVGNWETLLQGYRVAGGLHPSDLSHSMVSVGYNGVYFQIA
jgi:hypothetical protein